VEIAVILDNSGSTLFIKDNLPEIGLKGGKINL
jgi:hypothetical protein